MTCNQRSERWSLKRLKRMQKKTVNFSPRSLLYVNLQQLVHLFLAALEVVNSLFYRHYGTGNFSKDRLQRQ